MTVDAAQYVSQLDITKPAGTDVISEGDNEIRQVKIALTQTFPYVAGAVAASDVELGYCDGVTSAIQTQLDTKAPTASPTFTGSPVFSTGGSFTVAPTVPTAATATSDTSAASTAFVQAVVTAAALSSTVPVAAADVNALLSNDGALAYWRRPAGNTIAMYALGGF